MAEYVVSDGRVLVKEAASGDISEAITTNDGYTDMSGVALTMLIETTRNAVSILAHGPNRLARQLPGARAGRFVFTFVRDDGGTIDANAFFSAIDRGSGRFSFGVNTSKVGSTLVATVGNPQYAGSAIITRLNYWGAGDGNSAAVLAIEAVLDRDFGVYP